MGRDKGLQLHQGCLQGVALHVYPLPQTRLQFVDCLNKVRRVFRGYLMRTDRHDRPPSTPLRTIVCYHIAQDLCNSSHLLKTSTCCKVQVNLP